jgi:hypothetical protein
MENTSLNSRPSGLTALTRFVVGDAGLLERAVQVLQQCSGRVEIAGIEERCLHLAASRPDRNRRHAVRRGHRVDEHDVFRRRVAAVEIGGRGRHGAVDDHVGGAVEQPHPVVPQVFRIVNDTGPGEALHALGGHEVDVSAPGTDSQGPLDRAVRAVVRSPGKQRRAANEFRMRDVKLPGHVRAGRDPGHGDAIALDVE